MPLKNPGHHSATNKKGLQALTCSPGGSRDGISPERWDLIVFGSKFFLGLLPIEWVIFRPFEAFWKMEVIHSPGAASFNLRDRCGAVDNFLTFWSFCQNRLCFSLENIYQKF
jgi:hypothetical protein